MLLSAWPLQSTLYASGTKSSCNSFKQPTSEASLAALRCLAECFNHVVTQPLQIGAKTSLFFACAEPLPLARSGGIFKSNPEQSFPDIAPETA